jgi:hypothetical protein
VRDVLCRIAVALCLAGVGWVHAELYLGGYRQIAYVGPAFLVLASGSFAVAVLLLVSGSPVLRLLAVGLALGALGGFVMSRTVGIFGFVERGLQPAPQAILSLLFEIIVVAIVVVSWRILGMPGKRPIDVP